MSNTTTQIRNNSDLENYKTTICDHWGGVRDKVFLIGEALEGAVTEIKKHSKRKIKDWVEAGWRQKCFCLSVNLD